MTTKKKIIISVTAAVLVIAVAIVGVFAATSQTVAVQNTVSFTATDVNATVVATAHHAVGSDASAVGSDVTRSDATGNLVFRFTEESTTKTASFEDIVLTAENPIVVYTVAITNDGSKPFSITVTGLQPGANSNLTVTASVVVAGGSAQTVTPAASNQLTASLGEDETATLTVVVQITDDSLDATNDFQWDFTLAAVSA